MLTIAVSDVVPIPFLKIFSLFQREPDKPCGDDHIRRLSAEANDSETDERLGGYVAGFLNLLVIKIGERQTSDIGESVDKLIPRLQKNGGWSSSKCGQSGDENGINFLRIAHEMIDESMASIDSRMIEGDSRQDTFHVDLISDLQIPVRIIMDIRRDFIQLKWNSIFF